MSEWKAGDKAYVEAKFTGYMDANKPRTLRFSCADGCVIFIEPKHALRSIPPSSPSPVDVSQIKVGDEVTVKAIVKTVSCRTFEHPFELKVIGGDDADLDLVWVDESAFIYHTPSRPPSTLAEFKAMTNEQQERWFAETKGKVTT